MWHEQHIANFYRKRLLGRNYYRLLHVRMDIFIADDSNTILEYHLQQVEAVRPVFAPHEIRHRGLMTEGNRRLPFTYFAPSTAYMSSQR